jgi:hypothetical protein
VWRVLANPSPSYPPGAYLVWRFAPEGSSLHVDSGMAEEYDRKASARYGLAWSESGLYERSVHELKLTQSPAAW